MMWRENCANKVQLEGDVECSENCLLVHIAALDPVIYSTQAGTTCGLSSLENVLNILSSIAYIVLFATFAIKMP